MTPPPRANQSRATQAPASKLISFRLPAALLPDLDAYCRAKGLSHGEAAKLLVSERLQESNGVFETVAVPASEDSVEEVKEHLRRLRFGIRQAFVALQLSLVVDPESSQQDKDEQELEVRAFLQSVLGDGEEG